MSTLQKPRVICHMMSSLDGRIIVQRWGPGVPGRDDYETTAATFEAQAWLCGRVTMEKDFTKGRQPDLQPVPEPLDRTDFVAPHAAASQPSLPWMPTASSAGRRPISTASTSSKCSPSKCPTSTWPTCAA